MSLCLRFLGTLLLSLVATSLISAPWTKTTVITLTARALKACHAFGPFIFENLAEKCLCNKLRPAKTFYFHSRAGQDLTQVTFRRDSIRQFSVITLRCDRCVFLANRVRNGDDGFIIRRLSLQTGIAQFAENCDSFASLDGTHEI